MYTFSDERMTDALLCNGWETIWNDNNWVHEDCPNKDTAGISLEQAFDRLLQEKNI